MSGVLKIVLAGCGGISDQWLKALSGIADVSVAGLVDLQEEAAEKKKDKYQLQAKTGTDLEEMLQSVVPDLVFDCTVPEARASVVQVALRHGCHVLSEKPMAASMAEAHELIEISEKAGRLFAVMQNRRYNRQVRRFRDFLATGALGGLTTLNSDFYLGPHFGGFRDKMPHVLLLDMAIHSFDQARLISGADPMTVYCHEWNPRGSWYERDASAVAIFEMSNGVVYTYRGSWCAEGLNTSWECEWRAQGARGAAAWNGHEQFRAQSVAKDEGFTRPTTDHAVSVPESSPQSEGHAGCIREFIDCVRTGRTPETVCTSNIKSLSMVFGAIESAQTGKRVSISP